MTARLDFAAQRLRLGFQLPHRPEWVTEPRQYFFGVNGEGTAPAPPGLPGQLFRMAAYRDLSEMWLRAGDLYPQATVDKFAEADANLATLFGGRDFGEEILGSFGPQLQIVVARQTFDDGQPTPQIRLPSFGIQFTMTDPETMGPELRRIFQNLIGFINITGAMNGQPQFEVDVAKDDQCDLVMARYLPPRGEAASQPVKIHYNFSPAVAFEGDRFVLASTAALARDLALAKPVKDAAAAVNTTARLDAAMLQQVLRDNESQLVSQNMLEKGHDRREAEREIRLMLELLGYIRDANLQLQTGPESVELSVELGLEQ
ncbi:MAG: hypothetical protein R3B90_04985 [Planctomycetaceae bacterium]